MKKILALVLTFCIMVCFCGCSNKPSEIIDDGSDTPTSSDIASNEENKVVEKIPANLNPLTGIYEAEGIANVRPVAIMINNDIRAQNAQAGLPEADVIYETEIEGGETRLMAVFQDVEKVKNIGTVRSARIPFINLAQGHGAVYIHRGCEKKTVKPYVSQFERIDIHENLLGERLDNGLAFEHTLYTHGPILWGGIAKRFNTVVENAKAWQNFAAEDEKVTLSGGTANKITVSFSRNFVSIFVYDEATGLYERNFKSSVPTEYFTKESTKVKNVVVCLTDITDHPNGIHRNVDQSSGEGYYFTNGTYQEIKWEKGDVASPLKFKNADGSDLKMSAGNTWVCFSSQKYSKPKYE